MFETVRKHQRLMQFVLLVLIFPPFAFFGIQGYDRFFSDADVVATVDGAKIMRQQFESAHQEQAEGLRRVLGDRFDPALLATPEARARTLENLVMQHVLSGAASERRIAVSDAQLARELRALPGFTLPDGRFDTERYRAAVAAQGQSVEAFEARVRSDLWLRALPDAIADTALVPPSMVERVIGLYEQTREVRELAFSPAPYSAKVQLDDAQVAAWYERNPASFEVAESARVEALVLDREVLAARITVSEADARSYYEQNKARYATAEQRRASHILVSVEAGASAGERAQARARAEAIVAKLAGGADFAALARAESQDPGSAPAGGDLGLFTRETMAKPFADAAFALQPGQTSGIVETEFGLHVIRLAEVRPGTQRDFAAVRGEIEAEIRAQQASARFAEAAVEFNNLVYEEADSFASATKRFGIEVVAVDGIGRAGAPSLPATHPLNHPRLLKLLFDAASIERKLNTEAVDVGGNRLVSARIVEHRPKARKPLEAVRSEARALATLDAALALAKQEGEARLKALSGGAAADGFAAARTVTRQPAKDFPAAAVQAVFGAAAGKLPAFVGVDLGGQGYAIYQVTKVTPPDEKRVAAVRDSYRQQLQQIYSQQALFDYRESLKAGAKIERNPQRVATPEDR